MLFIDFDLGNVRSWYMYQTKIEKLNFSILMGYFLNKKLNGNRTTDNCHISAIQQNIKDTQHPHIEFYCNMLHSD